VTPLVRFQIVVGNPPPDPDIDALLAGFQRALYAIADVAKGLWIARAGALGIRHTGRYIAGIEAAVPVITTTQQAGKWVGSIAVTNRAPHASIVEDGHGPFSLAQAIDWARIDGKVKRTKDGRPYLHIPFRHYRYADADTRARTGMTVHAIKAMMPEHIDRAAAQLERTVAQNAGRRREWRRWVGPSGSGRRGTAAYFGSSPHPYYAANGQQYQQHLAMDRYRWGGRLRRPGSSPVFIMGGPGVSAGGPGEPGYTEHRSARAVGGGLVNPAWGSSKFEGLFKAGPKGHTQYMTIRTITPDSRGWNIPAQAGHGVARQVASHLGGPMAPRLTKLFEAAFKGTMG